MDTDTITTLIKEAHLPPGSIGVLLAFSLVGITLKWMFSESKTWLTPFEARKREKINFLKDLSKDEDDIVIKEVVQEFNKANIFYEYTNIKTAGQSEREQLLKIYNLSTPKFGWTAIRQTHPSLVKDNNGNFKPGIILVDRIFMTTFIIIAIIIFLAGIIFYVSPTPKSFTMYDKNIWRLVQTISFIFTTVIAMCIFNTTIPMIHALQLKNYILLLPTSTQASEIQMQQNG